MAHNNGMVPRKSGRKKDVSDNAAKFQAAVDAVQVLKPEADPAIDPAYQTANSALNKFSPDKLDVRAHPTVSTTGTVHAEVDSRFK